MPLALPGHSAFMRRCKNSRRQFAPQHARASMRPKHLQGHGGPHRCARTCIAMQHCCCVRNSCAPARGCTPSCGWAISGRSLTLEPIGLHWNKVPMPVPRKGFPMSRHKPLMPKATAVWLVENTSLSFEQIAEFCGLHVLEVKGIADGDVAHGIKGLDPISSGQLTREEIKRAEEEPEHRLRLAESKIDIPEVKTKPGPRYTPVSRRQD